MAAARRIGVNDDLSAEIAQQREVRKDRVEFLVDLPVEDAPVVPAGDEVEPVGREDGTKFGAVTRKFAAELGSAIPRLRGFQQAGFQRRVAAEFRARRRSSR